MDTIVVHIKDPPLDLKQEEEVRLIGIKAMVGGDTSTQDAHQFIRDRLSEPVMKLELAGDGWDGDNRLLGYVSEGHGDCLKANLIRLGFASVTSEHSHRLQDFFKGWEDEAREKGKRV